MGKGKIYTGTNMEEALKGTGTLPDFEGPFEYIHRAGGNLDIYFVSGGGEAECTFRVGGGKPEIWDPVTGHSTEAASYNSTADGRTTVPLALPENGSAFVVFRGKAEKNHFVSIDGPVPPEIKAKEGSPRKIRILEGWRVQLYNNRGGYGKNTGICCPSAGNGRPMGCNICAGNRGKSG